MQLITLAEAREELWREGAQTSSYAAATAAELLAWTARCNRVCGRLMGKMVEPLSYRRINVPVYDSHITLPRHTKSLLGVLPLTAEGCSCSPLFIYSRFFEFANPAQGCACCNPVAVPSTELAQTFRDSATGFRLKIVSTANGGTYTFLGGRDEDWGEYFDSVSVNIMDGGSDITTRVWNALPRILKSSTTAGCELYAVDSDNVETLIAIHAPGETSPAYQRYHIPECASWVAARILTKLCFVKLVADTDIVFPSSIEALQLGLQALNFEITSNWTAADDRWNSALGFLDSQKGQLEGDAELSLVSALPNFGAGDIPEIW